MIRVRFSTRPPLALLFSFATLLLAARANAACPFQGAGSIQNPNGLAVDASGNLWLANNGGGDVVKFTVNRSAAGAVTGLTPTTTCLDASEGVSGPTRLAFDANGYLYVANATSNSVTVYNLAQGLAPVATIGNLSRPLGVAVDGAGNVYIAENASNRIAVFQPRTAGSPAAGFTQASFSPLSQDGKSNAFLAPGFITYVGTPFGNVLVVGLGPTTGDDSITVYPAPWSSAPKPTAYFGYHNAACSTGPSGPTGVAVASPTTTSLTPYLANYYSSTINSYTVATVMTACPLEPALGPSNGIAHPEGVAVDTYGNLFVANASSNAITVYNSGFTASSAPSVTY